MIKILLLMIICFAESDSSREVLKMISYTFGSKLFECGEQFNYTRQMAEDILSYWSQEHPLLLERTGCLVICALSTLELIDPQGQLIRTNAEAYVRSNGADDELTSYLVEIYNRCHNTATNITNPCSAALQIVKCFRTDIHQRGWTPDVVSLMDIPHD